MQILYENITMQISWLFLYIGKTRIFSKVPKVPQSYASHFTIELFTLYLACDAQIHIAASPLKSGSLSIVVFHTRNLTHRDTVNNRQVSGIILTVFFFNEFACSISGDILTKSSVFIQAFGTSTITNLPKQQWKPGQVKQ